MTHPRYRTRAWRIVRAAALARDGYRCRLNLPGCRRQANSVDHTVRPEDGGSEYGLTNLVSCCVSCNTSKRNTQLAARARRQPNPLQRW